MCKATAITFIFNNKLYLVNEYPVHNCRPISHQVDVLDSIFELKQKAINSSRRGGNCKLIQEIVTTTDPLSQPVCLHLVHLIKLQVELKMLKI